MKLLAVALLVLLLGGCTDGGSDPPTAEPATPTAELTYNATVLDESLKDGAMRARLVITNEGNASGFMAPLNRTTTVKVWDRTTESAILREGPAHGGGASTSPLSDDDMIEIPPGTSSTILYEDGSFNLTSGHHYRVSFYYVYYPPDHHNVTVPVENEFTIETTWIAP